MEKERKEKKKTSDDLLDEVAEKAARKVLQLHYRAIDANHYRATEDLLRAYPRRLRIARHPEDFDFFPKGHSKDISVAPPKGSGVVDKIDAAEMHVEGRKRAYEDEMHRLYETEFAIGHFKDLPEFKVIRLVYFNEDIEDHDRGEAAKRYTWDQIADEMGKIGIERKITALRRWRSKLVREMTVMIFGAAGAISVNTRETGKGKGDKNAAEVENAEGKVHPENQE